MNYETKSTDISLEIILELDTVGIPNSLVSKVHLHFYYCNYDSKNNCSYKDISIYACNQSLSEEYNDFKFYCLKEKILVQEFHLEFFTN